VPRGEKFWQSGSRGGRLACEDNEAARRASVAVAVAVACRWWACQRCGGVWAAAGLDSSS
jgi:hypothetical protein